MFALFLTVVFAPPLAALLIGAYIAGRSQTQGHLGVFMAVVGGVAATLAFEWLASSDEDNFVAFTSAFDWIALGTWLICVVLVLAAVHRHRRESHG